MPEMYLMHMDIHQVIRLTKHRFLAATPGTKILGPESGGVYMIDRKKPVNTLTRIAPKLEWG